MALNQNKNKMINNKKEEELLRAKAKKISLKNSKSLFFDASRKKLMENKNAFVNYVTINLENRDLHNTTKLKKIKTMSLEKLQDLLKFNLNVLFKEYVKSARESKNLIEKRHTELWNIAEREYNQFKVELDEDFYKKATIIQEDLYAIEVRIKKDKKLILLLKKSLISKFDEEEKIILKLENKDDNTKKQRNIPFAEKQEEIRNYREPKQIKLEIEQVQISIDKLNTDRTQLIEELNDIKLEYTNSLDAKFIEKENNIVALDIDKLEVYIWIRNNLIAVNRVVRDVRINIGLRKIDLKRGEFYKTFDLIGETIRRIQEEFELFDSIGKVETKIKATQDIDTNTRIINLKTGESFNY